MTQRFRLTEKHMLALLILIGFGMRLYRVSGQPLSWDEGWSVGLSSLAYGEINRITALDVHPPLYYYALKPWLAIGCGELTIRFLSIAAGAVTIPLAYVTGRIWAGRRTGLWAALVVTVSPFLIYYAQVARMYSASAALCLASAYALLTAIKSRRLHNYAAAVLLSAVTIYTFYYSALVLVALFVYAFVIQPRRLPSLAAAGIGVAALYAPWVVYAVPMMLQRVGARTSVSFAPSDALQFVRDGAYGLVFAYGVGWFAVWSVAVILLTGLAIAVRNREPVRLLALPALAILLTLFAVSIGAKAHMFAARYLISASPFLALALGWSLDVCERERRWLGALAAVLLLGTVVPTLATHVYDKFYEVSGPFDPRADYAFLQDKIREDDMVFFNVLSLAGHYHRFKNASDPSWSYTLRWDPVVEELDVAVQRIQQAAREHKRLWFVLYKGTVAANLELKEWLDLNMYPVSGQWREDTLYEAYLSPGSEPVTVESNALFEKISLVSAAFAPRLRAGEGLALQLEWMAAEPITEQVKVFVHLYTADGRLVAQHDAVPVNELRPATTWRPGELIRDNHGLQLDQASGVLRLVVGLYNPVTGARLTTADGADHVELGLVEVLP